MHTKPACTMLPPRMDQPPQRFERNPSADRPTRQSDPADRRAPAARPTDLTGTNDTPQRPARPARPPDRPTAHPPDRPTARPPARPTHDGPTRQTARPSDPPTGRETRPTRPTTLLSPAHPTDKPRATDRAARPDQPTEGSIRGITTERAQPGAKIVLKLATLIWRPRLEVGHRVQPPEQADLEGPEPAHGTILGPVPGPKHVSRSDLPDTPGLRAAPPGRPGRTRPTRPTRPTDPPTRTAHGLHRFGSTAGLEHLGDVLGDATASRRSGARARADL